MLTHYIVIRRDLSFGEYSAQLAHAGEAYYSLARHHVMFGTPPMFSLNATTCIVKGIRNEGRLRKLQGQLVVAGIEHVAIIETDDPPDLGFEMKPRSLKNQLTCISILPQNKEKVEPFVRDIHTIEGLDGLEKKAEAFKKRWMTATGWSYEMDIADLVEAFK